MNEDTSKLERKDYEVPCLLHPVTEFDMFEGIPSEQLADIPVGGFIRDQVLREVAEFDFSGEGNGQPSPDANGKPGQGKSTEKRV